MRRRFLILFALLLPATAAAQTDPQAAARRRAAATRAQTEAAQPTGGHSMRGQATRPGLRAGHAYRHERERLKRPPVPDAP